MTVRYVSNETPKIGQWVTYCCDRGLFQLKTEEDVEGVVKDAELGIDRTIYDTLEKGLDTMTVEEYHDLQRWLQEN